jgi:lipopolysaccharide biosynthesis glycosyltransferase
MIIDTHAHLNFKAFDEDREKNWVLLNKCRLHEKTPYEKTLFLDSDTIVLKDISEAFQHLNESEFVVSQFSNWLTSGKRYRKRINAWEGKIPEEAIKGAYKEPKAINTGFYGWRKGAKIFEKWHDTAKLNRQGFIPDELACQIILPNYDYKILSSEYNTSCRHEPITDKARTIHYHGKKHCRILDGQYLNHSDLWYKAFDKIKHLPFVKENIQHDRMLVKNLGKHE